jgi:hypothetical protein
MWSEKSTILKFSGLFFPSLIGILRDLPISYNDLVDGFKIRAGLKPENAGMMPAFLAKVIGSVIGNSGFFFEYNFLNATI